MFLLDFKCWIQMSEWTVRPYSGGTEEGAATPCKGRQIVLMIEVGLLSALEDDKCDWKL